MRSTYSVFQFTSTFDRFTSLYLVEVFTPIRIHVWGLTFSPTHLRNLSLYHFIVFSFTHPNLSHGKPLQIKSFVQSKDLHLNRENYTIINSLFWDRPLHLRHFDPSTHFRDLDFYQSMGFKFTFHFINLHPPTQWEV